MTTRDQTLLREWAERNDLKLNVGASGRHVPGWLSIDLLRDPEGLCFKMDATKPWPFQDGQAQAINSEHFVEHLTREEVEAYFREAWRVLKPLGLIRTTTPDLEAICTSYPGKRPADLDAHRAHGYEAVLHADMINNYFYLGGHKRLWDFPSLSLLLSRVGFADVTRERFGASSHDLLRGIDRHDMGPLSKLVVHVDAVKPETTA